MYMGVSPTMVTFGPEGFKKINPLKTDFSHTHWFNLSANNIQQLSRRILSV